MSSVGANLAGGSNITVSYRTTIYLRARPNFFGTRLVVVDVLCAGLDAGYAIGMIIIFFVLQYPKSGTIGLDTIQQWWGNVVYTRTADFIGTPYKKVPEGETFGPSHW
jgi:hypothetical protein